MTQAYIMLGKFGDILSVLPILNHEFNTTGTPPNLVVSREYASILKDIDYVEPVEYRGSWHDLKGAIIESKSKFDRVIAGQVYGKGFPIQHRHASFQHDQWDRMNALEHWDNLTLNIPRFEGEPVGGKFILLCDHSQSSPFFWKEQLAADIKAAFPDHRIRRASEHRMDNVLGMVNLMDEAELVITVDTSLLHLSAATKTPTIALTADRPGHWNGSAWSKRFAFHCRYSDYTSKREQLLKAARIAVFGGSTLKPTIYSTLHPHGYNMSIAEIAGERLMTYRYHPSKNWKTRLAVQPEHFESHEIIMPAACKDYSIEDGRLFWHAGKLHLSYTCAIAEFGFFRCIQAYGPLELIKGQYTVTAHTVVRYRNNNFTTLEKNWVPYSDNGKLRFIYGEVNDGQVVIEVEGDRVVNEQRGEMPKWKWGQIRGGCFVQHNGKLIRFFHSRIGVDKPFKFTYHIGAMVVDPTDFKAIAISKEPIFSGNEKYTHCRHWKPNCALPYGAIEKDGRIQLAVGLNDCESALLQLTEKDLNL